MIASVLEALPDECTPVSGNPVSGTSVSALWARCACWSCGHRAPSPPPHTHTCRLHMPPEPDRSACLCPSTLQPASPHLPVLLLIRP